MIFNVQYFQDSADEAKQKSEDLLTACEELQKVLKESNEGMCTCWWTTIEWCVGT